MVRAISDDFQLLEFWAGFLNFSRDAWAIPNGP